MGLTLQNNDVITLLTISITYFLFVCSGGFEDILKKYIEVSGIMNLLLNSLLFMMLVRLMVDSVPIYLSIVQNISRRLSNDTVYEGQAVNTEHALKMKKVNLEDLVQRGFKKHDELTDENERNTLLVKIDNWHNSILDTNMKLASISSGR